MQVDEHYAELHPERKSPRKAALIAACILIVVTVIVVPTAVVLSKKGHHSNTDADKCTKTCPAHYPPGQIALPSQVCCTCINSLNGRSSKPNSFPNRTSPARFPSKPECNVTAPTPSGPFPKEFDARKRWPGWMQPVQNEGHCADAWALAISVSASDRLAIATNGSVTPLLSAGYLLDCNVNTTCLDGAPHAAWDLITSVGIPDAQCVPYTGERMHCPENNCTAPNSTFERYTGHSWGVVVGEAMMKQAIMTGGPITVVLELYIDFFCYTEGVYRHLDIGKVVDYHVLVLIGWGEDQDGTPYWIGQNDWGTDWGMRGYFHILRGVNECGVELGGFPGYCPLVAQM